jgi:DNA polymerase-3 subunit alpha/error-prone DNA polymerase
MMFFKEQLGETYGVMVYQEDVIKIALHYAGLPLPTGIFCVGHESCKGRSKQLAKSEDNYFACCAQRPFRKVERRDIPTVESFAVTRSVKHTLLMRSKVTKPLSKVYYPIEFMVAVINNHGGFIVPKSMCTKPRCLGDHTQPLC